MRDILTENKTIGKLFRTAAVTGSPLLIFLGTIYLYRYGSPFYCVVNKLTGLYCTGCGAGRAVYDLFHGNIVQALDHNMLMVLFFPIMVFYLFKVYLRLFLGREVVPFFSIPPKVQTIIIGILFLFTVLRNIPLYPFSVLAP